MRQSCRPSECLTAFFSYIFLSLSLSCLASPCLRFTGTRLPLFLPRFCNSVSLLPMWAKKNSLNNAVVAQPRQTSQTPEKLCQDTHYPHARGFIATSKCRTSLHVYTTGEKRGHVQKVRVLSAAVVSAAQLDATTHVLLTFKSRTYVWWRGSRHACCLATSKVYFILHRRLFAVKGAR